MVVKYNMEKSVLIHKLCYQSQELKLLEFLTLSNVEVSPLLLKAFTHVPLRTVR